MESMDLLAWTQRNYNNDYVGLGMIHHACHDNL